MPIRLWPRSLSARVFWLTVSIIFVVDILVMMPGLGRQWQTCLRNRVTQAELVAMFISGQGAANNVDPRTRDAMSSLSGTAAITLTGGGANISLLSNNTKMQLDPDVDLDHLGLWGSTWRAGRDVLGLGAPYLRVIAPFPMRSNMRIAIIISQHRVVAHLRRYTEQMVGFSMTVAVITGGLVYAALDRLLVKRMRIMTANIVAFRRDPEYARLSGLKWLTAEGDDEISQAARELMVMQDELRTVLWRNAQLAVLGTAVVKTGHDLRNILASALLVAGRFQGHADPVIRQAANTLVPSMERAVELVSRAVASTDGRPPAVTRLPVTLRELADEVADFIRQGESNMAIDNLLPGSLVLPLDRNQIYRVLVNLLRNAAEAGASRVTLTVEDENGVALLVVTDNGPGLPRKALAALFRPFTTSGRNGGTGLGLAIARDLIRAHGGDLLLRKTGSGGTEFVMTLPVVEDATVI